MDNRVERVLVRLESIEDRMSTFWNVPRSTGLFLNMLVRVAGLRSVLEIGTSNGYSGIWLAEALSHSDGRLYTVESHAQRFELARANFKESGLASSIEQIKGHAPQIFPALGSHIFDLVFLDATKMEYKSYLDGVLPLLAPRGLIIADNSTTHARELQDFFDVIEKSSDLDGALLPIDNGLFVIGRKATNS